MQQHPVSTKGSIGTVSDEFPTNLTVSGDFQQFALCSSILFRRISTVSMMQQHPVSTNFDSLHYAAASGFDMGGGGLYRPGPPATIIGCTSNIQPGGPLATLPITAPHPHTRRGGNQTPQ
eukprot:gene20101-26817_t